MAGSRFSIEAVISMIDRVSKPMQDANRSVSMFSRNSQRHFGGVGAAALGAGGVMRGVIGASLLAGASVSIVGLADKAISLSSDLTEVQNVVDTTFGKSANTINKWSQSAITQFGLSELQAKKFNGTMGAMLKSSGLPINNLANMSTKLTGLSGDFASFYNLDAQTAFDKIRSGISGETEPLKQLGINMSVANLEAFALTQGITKQWKNMNQAEQVMIRYNYLLGASKDAQGDFAKTLLTSYANQKRVFATNLDQTLARIATQILPDLTNGIIKLNEWLTSVDAVNIGKDIRWFAETLWKLRYVIMAVVGAFYAYRLGLILTKAASISLTVATKALALASLGLKAFNAVKILGFAGALKYAFAGTKALAAAQWLLNAAMLANPIGLVIAAIVILIAEIAIVVKYWDSFGAALTVFMGPVGTIISLFKTIYDRWNDITTAFQAGGMLQGIIMIGKVIMDSILYPIQQLLQIIGKIPGMGFAASAASSIQGFRENSLGAKPVNAPAGTKGFASPQSTSMAAGVSTQSNLDINVRAPKGTTEVSATGLTRGMKLNQGAQ